MSLYFILKNYMIRLFLWKSSMLPMKTPIETISGAINSNTDEPLNIDSMSIKENGVKYLTNSVSVLIDETMFNTKNATNNPPDTPRLFEASLNITENKNAREAINRCTA